MKLQIKHQLIFLLNDSDPHILVPNHRPVRQTRTIPESLAASMPDSAKTINEAIIDTNTIESNLKLFYSLYFDKLIEDIELDATDSTFLEEIISGNRKSNGAAFHNALATLFKEVHPSYIASKTASSISNNIENPKFEPTVYHVNIYPNPASTIITVNLLEKEDHIVLLEIYNSVGMLVLSKQCSQNVIELSMDSFKEGLYNLRSFTAKGIVETKTFNLIR